MHNKRILQCTLVNFGEDRTSIYIKRPPYIPIERTIIKYAAKLQIDSIRSYLLSDLSFELNFKIKIFK